MALRGRGADRARIVLDDATRANEAVCANCCVGAPTARLGAMPSYLGVGRGRGGIIGEALSRALRAIPSLHPPYTSPHGVGGAASARVPPLGLRKLLGWERYGPAGDGALGVPTQWMLRAGRSAIDLGSGAPGPRESPRV